MEWWMGCQNCRREWTDCNMLKQGCSEHFGSSDIRSNAKVEKDREKLSVQGREHFQK